MVMSPLTRCRAGAGRVPNALMAESHYTQRVTAGLIISEATSVTPMGVGYVARALGQPIFIFTREPGTGIRRTVA